MNGRQTWKAKWPLLHIILVNVGIGNHSASHRQGMPTPPRHQILLWHIQGVRISLVFTVNCSMFHLPDLDKDFDCGFFRLPDWTH
jgi:hypothetical protein